MRECRRPRKNGPSREELSKQAFSLASGFREPEVIKTSLIIALYCILSRLPVSEVPPSEAALRPLSAEMATSADGRCRQHELGKGKDLQLSKPGAHCGSKIT